MLEQIRQLPDHPGIYQYFDEANRLLYVGKAKSLAKRVKSYFRFTPELAPNSTLSARIKNMIIEARSLHYIVVETEHDALILENSLIKQLRPKYNILLRDDKTYPYIYVDRANPFPRYEITRKVVTGKKIQYFGPYSIGARDILDSVYELLPLVQKQSCLRGKKLCLFYQMKKCLGPCEEKITPEAYTPLLEEADKLIENKKILLEKLTARMNTLAENLRFEEAAALRDRIDRIERSEQLSQIDLANKDNYDIFAIADDVSRIAIVRLFMRHGKIVSSAFDVLRRDDAYDRDELYERTLLEFYGHDKPPIIAPILIADTFENVEWVASALEKLFGKKALIHHPKRGDKRKVINLARLNAQELLRRQQTQNWEHQAKQLQVLCQLSRLPERIEIFDNSHLSGEAPVGAMVVFEKNSFIKAHYRHYHLETTDEYSQMKEVLTRRIEGFSQNPPPDLWIIDGGTTLLNLAKNLLNSEGTNLEVIAISKEKVDAKAHRAKGKANDLIHTHFETFRLSTGDTRLQWIQKLRDEAHRFAISFHRKVRAKHTNSSKLLQAHGISEAKIHKLLAHFGTFQAIYEADESSLAEILNQKDAKSIKILGK